MNTVLAVADHKRAAPLRVGCAVLTVSDTRTADTDISGALLRDRIVDSGHDLIEYEIVSDDADRVRERILNYVSRREINAVLVNGGTGIAPRDNTYEAISALLERRLDGFGELFRSLSYGEVGPAAMLSRAVAGVVSSTVIFSMPGSPPACALAADRLILPELGHVVGLLGPKPG